nr:hypothetical protein [Lachnospiraceae bacterium]
TLDSHTSDICQEMDGKHFKMSEWEVGTTAPPFHVYCRSTTVPYFDDNIGERAARGEDGKTYYVPSDMTYKEWEKSFVKGDKTNVKPVQKTESKKEDDISSYISQRKIYDEKMQELSNLEKESGEILDAFMDAIDTPKADELEEAYNKKYDELEHLREIIKDVKSALKGKEAKAVRQIEKNLAIKTGMDIKNIDMTGLEYDTANSIYNAYATVLDKYPEVKKNLTSFRYSDKKGDAYASCVALTGEVKAHGMFKNFAKFVQQYADDVSAKFHPIGTDYNSIIVHELGHALDGYMTKEKMLNATYNQYGVIRSSLEVQKRVLEKLGWDFDYVKNLRDDLTLKGYNNSQIADTIKKEKEKFITNHISEYAAKNEKEFFAECFAEWIMSKTPRKAAQIFGEIIDGALGR